MPVMRRAVASRMRPPAATTIPIQQQTGLSEKEPASFTANEPPQYPSKAVRDRLQGTVLLRLFFDSTGRVEAVELIEDRDPTRKPLNRWRSHAHLLFGNWVNQVYQSTPYDHAEIGADLGTG